MINMTDKIDDDGTALLVESEARFREALGRLAKALVGTREMKSEIRHLKAEKEVLERGLGELKSDYEMLEKSFQAVTDRLAISCLLALPDSKIFRKTIG